MSGISGIGRGRSRGILMQKFLNKDLVVSSIESIEGKMLNNLAIPSFESSTENTSETSSQFNDGNKSGKNFTDSDAENKTSFVVKRPMSFLGRGRGINVAQSLQTSPVKSKNVIESEEPVSLTKITGRGRGVLSSKHLQPEIANEMQQMTISESLESSGITGTEDVTKFENTNKDFSNKIRRREQPCQIKEPCDTRNDKSESIKVSTNYVKVQTVQPHLYQYHVTFAPSIESRLMRVKMVQLLTEEQLGVVPEARAFDGMNLFVPKLLKNNQTVLQVSKLNDKTVTIQVKITFVKNVSFSECPMVYNVLFKRIENALKMVKIGRDYFHPERKIVLQRLRMEIWPGYVTSIQNYDGGLLLQCDVSHKIIRNDSVYDIMMEINKTMRNKSEFQDECINNFLGQIILTPHNNRNYRITDIDWTKNCLSEFDRNGEKTTYNDYFRDTYGLKIRDLEQPLLVSKTKKSQQKSKGVTNKEDNNDLLYLIPELCMMTGLTDEMVKDFRMMRDIQEHCRVTPKRRHEALLEFVDNIYKCEEAKNILDYWGITIDRQTLQINGCQMNPEIIQFGRGASVSADDKAEFKQALACNQVISGLRIENWLMIMPKSLTQKAHSLIQSLISKGPKVGVLFKNPKIVEIQNDRTEEYVKALRSNIAPNVQVVVTVLNAVREDRYNAIKKLCYVDSPVPSQVVLGQTLKEGPKLNSVAINIALQINAKLGGELWAVRIPIKKFMVVGLDVWHDSPSFGKGQSRSGRSRSVGAVVGSTNALCTRWFSKSAFQAPHQEIVDVLQSLMISLLKAYYEENGFLPETIFMYRDGVGDGQLGLVQKTEIEQFLLAFKSLSDDYKPYLVYNVVQKRINTRLFLGGEVADPRINRVTPVINPNPGTVVDHTVTRANLYDFFLVSQSVRQGTVTPTHYIILFDNSKYTPHQVQLMAYKTCHIYYNWPGTVRVPAPCMYAHKLAYMVGQNLKVEPSNLMNDRLFYL